jgi:hypothetical protein
MHKAIKKAIETEALQDTQEALRGIGPRLDSIEDKLDRVLARLEQVRSPGQPQQQQSQRGGR